MVLLANSQQSGQSLTSCCKFLWILLQILVDLVKNSRRPFTTLCMRKTLAKLAVHIAANF